MYDPSGYLLVNGTSFSAPLVAGAAALLKSARPGLSVDQYRSLLINTTMDAQAQSGSAAAIQRAGAGALDVSAALRSTVAAYPVSLSFGSGGADVQMERMLTLSNVGTAAEAFLIAAAPRTDAPAPSVATSTVELEPGASIDIPVSWTASGLAAGTYEGFLTVTGAASGAAIRIPYWYASTAGVPARITVLKSVTTGRRGSLRADAVLFRITDASGVALAEVQPDISVVSGGGSVAGVTSHDNEVPGLFGLDVQLGFSRGANVFRIQAGEAVLDAYITGW
jgi:minor extracellular serine protease Vpr